MKNIVFLIFSVALTVLRDLQLPFDKHFFKYESFKRLIVFKIICVYVINIITFKFDCILVIYSCNLRMFSGSDIHNNFPKYQIFNNPDRTSSTIRRIGARSVDIKNAVCQSDGLFSSGSRNDR